MTATLGLSIVALAISAGALWLGAANWRRGRPRLVVTAKLEWESDNGPTYCEITATNIRQAPLSVVALGLGSATMRGVPFRRRPKQLRTFGRIVPKLLHQGEYHTAQVLEDELGGELESGSRFPPVGFAWARTAEDKLFVARMARDGRLTQPSGQRGVRVHDQDGPVREELA